MQIIAEKLNGFVPATGKAIEARDDAYIRDIAAKEAAAGSTYIDCCPATNVGALEIMKWLVDNVQAVTDTPISLDSPDPDVLIAAMEFCNKPGLINSASLAAGKVDKIFSAIADTKWNCVVMLDDDNGIPATAQGRIDVFRKVLAKAEEYGIDPTRLYFDPLVETLGTNEEAFLTFAEVCRAVKAECPKAHLTSGLSNISYGLPARKFINIPFMILCMAAGMDSAIVDPLNRDMIGCIYGAEALLGYDDYCMEYLGAYRENLFGPLER